MAPTVSSDRAEGPCDVAVLGEERLDRRVAGAARGTGVTALADFGDGLGAAPHRTSDRPVADAVAVTQDHET
jgi:hypothetical protein